MESIGGICFTSYVASVVWINHLFLFFTFSNLFVSLWIFWYSVRILRHYIGLILLSAPFFYIYTSLKVVASKKASKFNIFFSHPDFIKGTPQNSFTEKKVTSQNFWIAIFCCRNRNKLLPAVVTQTVVRIRRK